MVMCFGRSKPAAKVKAFKDDRRGVQQRDANFERTLIFAKKLS